MQKTDWNKIISKYYPEGMLRDSLILHSRMVMEKAIAVANNCSVEINLDFVKDAAMLHDIGIVKCNAPDIYCVGIEPYIRHGIIGREMLEAEGLNCHALVCERHTGSGLSRDYIINKNLPLPHRDMLPITNEEKLICYADKFYSKSGNLTKEKTIEEIIGQMKRHGEEATERFYVLHRMFTKN